MIKKKKAVVLLSGGLDSTTTLAIARSLGYKLFALSFQYGQHHDLEIKAAKAVAEYFRVDKHLIIRIDLNAIGGSALTDDMPIPKDRVEDSMRSEIPDTYVPARNTIFLSYALAWAEVLEAEDIFIGVNAVDYSGYPDCRPEFIEAFQRMAQLATKAGVESKHRIKIHTPLSSMTKSDIIKKGITLGVDYSLTHTCYDPSPDGLACGRCDACRLRLRGFAQAGITDPLDYIHQ
ncbi:MAG: 7-cyano-7-deazaguanine synthase QueC [candidate division Zixibacteria bacterium]|nr:7-cyano-7-deazaguanine synthase QueC [candidate division Zixibacteria bacterium]